MGEIADMMLDGTFCQACGGVMEDVFREANCAAFEAPGFPRTCGGCMRENRPRRRKKGRNGKS